MKLPADLALQANTKMFTIMLYEILTGMVVFDNLSICHEQQKCKDNIFEITAPCQWLAEP